MCGHGNSLHVTLRGSNNKQMTTTVDFNTILESAFIACSYRFVNLRKISNSFIFECFNITSLKFRGDIFVN